MPQPQRAFTEPANRREPTTISPGGWLVPWDRCPTTLAALVGAVSEVRRPRVLVIEAAPPTDWLYRGLSERGETVVVCDPRRHHPIAKDSNKDDAIEAEKLGLLYRGGLIKAGHHSDSSDRVVFHRRVALYHDQVRKRVRAANRLMAQCRRLWQLTLTRIGFGSSFPSFRRGYVSMHLPTMDSAPRAKARAKARFRMDAAELWIGHVIAGNALAGPRPNPEAGV